MHMKLKKTDVHLHACFITKFVPPRQKFLATRLQIYNYVCRFMLIYASEMSIIYAAITFAFLIKTIVTLFPGFCIDLVELFNNLSVYLFCIVPCCGLSS